MSQDFEDLLLRAAEGDSQAARDFFSLFLGASLIVPDRAQPQALSMSPHYPNDLTYILGVQEQDRVFIPAFLSVEAMQEWSAALVNFRSITGRKLLELTPSDWWVCFMPGNEISKEFSPWEVEKLLGDESSIEEVLEDLFPAGGSPTEIELEVPQDEEFFNLKKIIKEYFSAHSEIRTVYLLKQKPTTDELGTLIIGLEIAAEENIRVKRIAEGLQALAQKTQIGAESVRVVGANSITNPDLALFREFEPLLVRTTEKKPSLLRRLFRG